MRRGGRYDRACRPAARWWAPDLLAAAGLDRMKMPGLFEPGAVAGVLTADAARATGLREGIPVVLAGGDGQSFAVGLGARSGSGFTLTLGTSIVLGLPSLAPSISSLYRTLIAARPDDQYLLESVIQAGTYIVRWFSDTFGGAAQDRKRSARSPTSRPGARAWSPSRTGGECGFPSRCRRPAARQSGGRTRTRAGISCVPCWREWLSS